MTNNEKISFFLKSKPYDREDQARPRGVYPPFPLSARSHPVPPKIKN